MQLTLVNFFKKTVPGHIFRGKRRLVRQVTSQHKKFLIRDFEQQERNMTLLRVPYLTLAESHGHAKELEKTPQKIKFWNENPMKPAFRTSHIKIEHRLDHLRHNENWD